LRLLRDLARAVVDTTGGAAGGRAATGR